VCCGLIFFHAQPVKRLQATFDHLGFVSIRSLLIADEVAVYGEIVRQFLKGEINASAHRHDLGAMVCVGFRTQYHSKIISHNRFVIRTTLNFSNGLLIALRG
jgi:hypothetical protein